MVPSARAGNKLGLCPRNQRSQRLEAGARMDLSNLGNVALTLLSKGR
jgi:hypothetical protein